MADNTRKTSNIIHEVSDLKDQMDKIQDKIESIDIGDAYISTINNTKPDENGDIGIVDAGNVDVSKSGNNITLAVDLSGLADKGDIPTVNDGKINLQASNGVKLAAGSQNATANQSGTSTFKVEADLEYLNANLDIPEDKSAANDGQINMTGGTGIDVTGQNATANQENNTAWNVSIDDTVALKSDIPTIPPPVVPGDGSISLNAGDGMTVSGSNATANQDGNTAWTVKTDNTYLNANLDFAKPDDIPTQYVKDIQSGNLLTLTVDEEDGVYTLTAIGGGGSGGTGDIAFGEGQCIEIETETVGDLTTYVINCDLECLEANLNFVKPDDLPDIPDGTLPISSTDGTVTLDSPSANTFTVSTGGEERVAVADASVTSRVDQVLQINKSATTAPSNAGNVNNKQMMTLKSTDEAGAKFIGVSFQHVLSGGNGASACIGLQDESADGVPNKGEMQFVIRGDDSAQVVKPLKINKDAIIVDGQVQTNTITTKDAATADGKINLSGTGVELYSNYNNYNTTFKLQGNSLIYTLGANASVQKVYLPNPDYVDGTGTPKNIQHLEQYYYGLGWTSGTVQNAGAGGTTFDYQVGSLITMARKQNSLICYNTEKTESAAFAAVCDDTNKYLRLSIDGNARVTISEDDIQAFAGYVPQTDQSLVTKGWVTTNGASGTLPISSTDGTVTLDSPAENSFEIKLDSGSSSPGKSRFFIDDESTTILPKSTIVSGAPADDETLTNALRLYTDSSKNYIGFGISSGTLNIAACKAVANIDVWAKSTKAARFTQAGIFLYSDEIERFRIRGDGPIGLGDSATGARTQGIRAVYNDLVTHNWISFYDSTTIPDNTDSDAPVKNVYGHWIQPRSRDVTQSCTYYAFYALAPVQQDGGLLKTYIGAAVENCTIANNATSFQSNQNTAASGTYYSFYASGTAPARLNGGVQTDTITSEAGVVNGPIIELGDDKAIRLRTNYSERVVIEEDGTMTSQMVTTPVGTNRTAYKINETGNTGENSFSIDWVFANGAFANTDAQGRIDVRREGPETVGGSANFSMEFFVASRPTGTSESDVLTKALEIRYDGQLIAKDGYIPETDNSLVTKGWAAANTRLPAMGDDAGGNDFRVEYLDRNHNDEGVEEIDPANPSCVRLGVLGGLATAGVTRAGAFLVDGLGRLLASQSGYNSSQKPSRSQQFGLYSATDIGNTRTGVALRGVHYGDVPEGTTQQGISYTYGCYSSPNFQDLKATTAVDFIAIGPSGSIDADTGESLTNGNCQTAIGFSVPSNFGTYIKHPSGGNPITQGFRSDLAVKEDKNQYAIFVNGSAPSRFNSPIQLTANSYLSDATETSCQLYIAGGYWNIRQGPDGSPSGGTALCFRFNDDRKTPNSWFKWSGKDADGNIQNAWFGYEQDTKRYRFLNDTGAYSMYEVQVDSSDASFNVANGDVNMLKVSRANNTQTVTRSWTQIATASMPTDWVPTADHNLATKKYVDDNAGGGGSSGVNKIIAGSNITVSPLDGTGNVTVNAVVPDVGVTKIIGGTNVTVSPADGTGTVTINATSSGGGGADSLVDLDDVVVTDPKGNEVLTYDITTGKWINKAPPSGGGGGGIIDGGQVPGTGSTFIWYDTEYKDITHINGEIVKQYADQPRYMYAYDGVFSDGTFWTLDGVNFRVDPNAISSGGRYGGKFSTTSYTQFQGRVIAGEFGYWAEKYFSQDMKQWSETSGGHLTTPSKQGIYPCGFSAWRVAGSGYSNNYSAFERLRGGDWEFAYCGDEVHSEAFPESYTMTGCWTANQFSGEETAVTLYKADDEYRVYCLDVADTNSFTYGNSFNDSAIKAANDVILKNSITPIPALDGCTTGFFSERLQKWLFAKENTVFISNTASLKGGFTTKSLPRSNAWDRCYDDGSAIVFAKTESGNSATVFSADAGQSWSVSISLINRNYKNFAGTNGRAMATYEYEQLVDGFIPDPADPSGEGVLPIKYATYRYAVSGVDDPNPAEARTRDIKLTHPVSIASARAIEAQTQEDANGVFTEEIQRRSPVLTLTQAEYDAIPANEIEDDTLYLITS